MTSTATMRTDDAAASEAIAAEVGGICRRARRASRQLARSSDETRNAALAAIAARMRADSARIRAENAADLEAGRAAGLSAGREFPDSGTAPMTPAGQGVDSGA